MAALRGRSRVAVRNPGEAGRGRVDLHARKPRKVLDVPGASLEVRCAWPPNDEARFVRNVYSLSFLGPELLGNDIATLGLDRDQDAAGARRGGSE